MQGNDSLHPAGIPPVAFPGTNNPTQVSAPSALPSVPGTIAGQVRKPSLALDASHPASGPEETPLPVVRRYKRHAVAMADVGAGGENPAGRALPGRHHHKKRPAGGVDAETGQEAGGMQQVQAKIQEEHKRWVEEDAKIRAGLEDWTPHIRDDASPKVDTGDVVAGKLKHHGKKSKGPAGVDDGTGAEGMSKSGNDERKEETKGPVADTLASAELEGSKSASKANEADADTESGLIQEKIEKTKHNKARGKGVDDGTNAANMVSSAAQASASAHKSGDPPAGDSSKSELAPAMVSDSACEERQEADQRHHRANRDKRKSGVDEETGAEQTAKAKANEKAAYHQPESSENAKLHSGGNESTGTAVVGHSSKNAMSGMGHIVSDNKIKVPAAEKAKVSKKKYDAGSIEDIAAWANIAISPERPAAELQKPAIGMEKPCAEVVGGTEKKHSVGETMRPVATAARVGDSGKEAENAKGSSCGQKTGGKQHRRKPKSGVDEGDEAEAKIQSQTAGLAAQTAAEGGNGHGKSKRNHGAAGVDAGADVQAEPSAAEESKRDPSREPKPRATAAAGHDAKAEIPAKVPSVGEDERDNKEISFSAKQHAVDVGIDAKTAGPPVAEGPSSIHIAPPEVEPVLISPTVRVAPIVSSAGDEAAVKSHGSAPPAATGEEHIMPTNEPESRVGVTEAKAEAEKMGSPPANSDRLQEKLAPSPGRLAKGANESDGKSGSVRTEHAEAHPPIVAEPMEKRILVETCKENASSHENTGEVPARLPAKEMDATREGEHVLAADAETSGPELGIDCKAESSPLAAADAGKKSEVPPVADPIPEKQEEDRNDQEEGKSLNGAMNAVGEEGTRALPSAGKTQGKHPHEGEAELARGDSIRNIAEWAHVALPPVEQPNANPHLDVSSSPSVPLTIQDEIKAAPALSPTGDEDKTPPPPPPVNEANLLPASGECHSGVNFGAPDKEVASTSEVNVGTAAIPSCASRTPSAETLQDGVVPATTKYPALKPKSRQNQKRYLSSHRGPLSGIVPASLGVKPIDPQAAEENDKVGIEVPGSSKNDNDEVHIGISQNRFGNVPNIKLIPPIPDTAAADTADNANGKNPSQTAEVTRIMVQQTEEIKQYTPTVNDVNLNASRAAIPGIIPENEAPPSSSREMLKSSARDDAAEDSYESHSYSSGENNAEVGGETANHVAATNPGRVWTLGGENVESYESGSFESKAANENDNKTPAAEESYESHSYAGDSAAVPGETAPECESPAKIVLVEAKPELPKNFVYSRLVLVFVILNLMAIATAFCLGAVAYSSARRTRSRLKTLRTTTARRLEELYNGTSNIGASFSASRASISDTFGQRDSLWDLQDVVSALSPINDSASTWNGSVSSLYTTIAAKVDGEMAVLPALITNYATQIGTALDNLKSTLDSCLAYAPSILNLISEIRSKLPSVTSTVESTASTLSTFSTTMEAYIADITPKLLYSKGYKTQTTFNFYPTSMTCAIPAKKILLVSVPGDYHLASVLDTSLVSATITNMDYGLDTTDWPYQLPDYNALMFDLHDGYYTVVTFGTLAQQSMIAFMDRGGSVMFSHDTMGSTASGWDSNLYTYCGINAASIATTYTTSVDKYTSNTCHQIYSYPNDMTSFSSLTVVTTHNSPYQVSTGALLYGYVSFQYVYLAAKASSTTSQRCAITTAGHTSTLNGNENKLMNNVAYWLVHTHYGGN